MNPKHLRIESWPPRPSGGMSVGMPNGLKITHIPSGISVACDTERSQHKNREKALRELEQRIAAIDPPSRA